MWITISIYALPAVALWLVVIGTYVEMYVEHRNEVSDHE